MKEKNDEEKPAAKLAFLASDLLQAILQSGHGMENGWQPFG